jgi:DNA-directed RNA polymerase specialized sigma24 family protein
MPYIPSKRLEALMSLFSYRDLPKETRSAVRLVVINGFTYELAEIQSGVSRKRISLAVRKLDEADNTLLKAYRSELSK